MRVDQVTVLGMDRFYDFWNFGIRHPRTREPEIEKTLEPNASRLAKVRRELANLFGITFNKIVQKALEIGSDLNVHRGSKTGRNRTKRVFTGLKKSMQYIVPVSRHSKFALFSALAIADRNVLTSMRAAFRGINLSNSTPSPAVRPGKTRATSLAFLGEIRKYLV